MCTQPQTAARALLDAQPAMRAAVQNSSTFEVLKEKLRKVTVDGEQFFLVEGDMLLDEDQLSVYAVQQDALRQARMSGLTEVGQSARLVGILQNNKIVRWALGKVLTYCVLRNTFANQEQYETVVANMEGATRAWEATCGVRFQYLREFDDSTSTRPDGVLFPVRGIDAGGQFIAAAFFPNDPINRRRILIDPSYFSTTFDRVGVLRHELGHVLGFRHEHIRSEAPPVCPDEALGETINLTQYDPQSVMHYFCGGVGSRDLAITEIDRSGSQRVYGPSLEGLFFVD